VALDLTRRAECGIDLAHSDLSYRVEMAAEMDFIYVDNSNLYIEGRRVSAVKRKLAKNITQAMQNDILDQGYIISFGKLHQFLCGHDKRQIKRAALFGSRPPPNDGIWTYAKKAG
jgi:hypothetical protein